jgi:hypothetical protein
MHNAASLHQADQANGLREPTVAADEIDLVTTARRQQPCGIPVCENFVCGGEIETR